MVDSPCRQDNGTLSSSLFPAEQAVGQVTQVDGVDKSKAYVLIALMLGTKVTSTDVPLCLYRACNWAFQSTPATQANIADKEGKATALAVDEHRRMNGNHPLGHRFIMSIHAVFRVYPLHLLMKVATKPRESGLSEWRSLSSRNSGSSSLLFVINPIFNAGIGMGSLRINPCAKGTRSQRQGDP